ncbi:MAG: TauD/TfdA family dioxygenase [Steroidobacteraceae bacterium]
MDRNLRATLDSVVTSGQRPLGLRITGPAELTLQRSDGSEHAVHPLWLRERCTDATSIDLKTRQRLQDPSDFDPELRILAVSQPAAGIFRVRFSDGHEGSFEAAAILAEAALAPASHDCPAPRLWDGKLGALPRARWSAEPVEGQLESWLESFLERGFVILEGVPAEPGMVLRVGAQFGFVRETNFGALFDVRSTPEATDLAYTSVALDPHTDNPYRTPVPGIQLLHCLVNETSGGLSTLVDGFAVAHALRASHREAFSVLTGTPVRFRYTDADTELTASAAPIALDVTGELAAIHFSPRLDFVPLYAPERLEAYYRARRLFDAGLRAPDFEIRFLLAQGDLVMFDNTRLLHGRTGFDPAEGLRHLQGCYIDLDGPRSLYRVLRRRHGAEAERRSA